MTALPYGFAPVHPGEILKEELQTRHISQKKMAQLLGLPYTMLNEILNAKRPLTTDTALVFEAALGISAELLVGIQTRYNLQTARVDTKNNARLAAIRKVCASLL